MRENRDIENVEHLYCYYPKTENKNDEFAIEISKFMKDIIQKYITIHLWFYNKKNRYKHYDIK